MADVVKLQPKHREAPALQWEFHLNRETHGLELVVQDDAGTVIATVTWRHASTTPGRL